MGEFAKVMLDRKEIDKSVYEMAIERINHLYDLFDHVCVSFSGGKDSTACLNLALEVARDRGRLPLRAIFFDEEAIPYQTEEYVRRLSQNPGIDIEWYCLPVKHRNACSRKSPAWWPWAPEDKDLWVRPMPPEALTELEGFQVSPKEKRMSIPELSNLLSPAQKYGSVGMILGIRTQESLTRYRAVVRREHDNYIIQVGKGKHWGGAKEAQGNLYKAYPIYDWKTEDVWTAPKVFGWDYNRAYDVMDKYGLAPPHQRVSPAFGEEPIRNLAMWAECFPELWEKMLDRVPGAAAAMRYSKTELWAYGGKPVKPDGVSWQEFIERFIRRFDPKSQKIIAGRIKREIAAHFQKTSDPILGDAPHPWTGVSWQWLLQIAMRGDFKERKQSGYNINTNQMDRHCREYADEYRREKGREWKGMNLKP